MAERTQDGHGRDGDERQDERVLHHRLTLFLIPKGREREVRPHRDLLRPLHLVPPSRLPRAWFRHRTEEPRSIPATEFVAYVTDRHLCSYRHPLEGWVWSGPKSRLEACVYLAEDRGGETADRAQERERSRRNEDEDEGVFDQRLPLFAVTQAEQSSHEQLGHQSALPESRS